MVAVPVYQRQAELGGLPGARVSPADVSSGVEQLARGVANAGRDTEHGSGVLFEAFAQEREKQRTALLMDAYAQLGDADLTLRDTLRSYQGKAAMPRQDPSGPAGTMTSPADTLVKNFDDYVKRIGGGIADRTAAQAFKAQALGRRQSFVEAVNGHVAAQGEVVAEDAFKATLTTAAAQASATAAGDSISMGGIDFRRRGIDQAASETRMAVAKYAADRGWDDSKRDAVMLAAVGGLHLGVVDAMLGRGDSAGAAAYLGAHRPEIGPDALAESKADDKVHAATALAQSVGLADQAWTETGGDPGEAAGWLRAQVGVAPEVLDDALGRVDKRGADEAQARRQADAPLMGRLEQRLYEVGAPRLSDAEFRHLTAGMSDEGKGNAAYKRLALENARGAHGRESKRDQNNRNAEFLSVFDELDPADKAQVDVDALARTFEAENGPVESHAVQKVRAKKQAATQAYAKDNGVAADDFKKLVDEALADVDRSAEEKKAIAKYMNAWHAGYRNPKNPDLPPALDEVKRKIDGWLQGKKRPWYQPDVLGVEEEIEGQRTARENLPTSQEMRDDPEGSAARLKAAQQAYAGSMPQDTPGGGRAPEAAMAPADGPVRLRRKKDGRLTPPMDREAAQAFLAGGHDDTWELVQ